METREKININLALVRRLITNQFPQWKDLSIRPVAVGGWDNRTFHLGENMLVRLPSAAKYTMKVEKEQRWLPKLAPFLPLAIPEPLAVGEPGEGYPWRWSVYRWIEGETAASGFASDMKAFADDLAHFLYTFQKIDTTDGPLPGPHNFFRGGALSVYDGETRQALEILKEQIDTSVATQIWERALKTEWSKAPVWVHGDISPGNLLVKDGKLIAVIDFGGLAIGDPACDLAIAWTFFQEEDREVFRASLSLDEETWIRGVAWALWKALIVAAGICETNAVEAKHAWHTIHEILTNYKNSKL